MDDINTYWCLQHHLKQIIRLNKTYGLPKKSDNLWENQDFFESFSAILAYGIVKNKGGYDLIQYLYGASQDCYTGTIANAAYREALEAIVKEAEEKLVELRKARQNKQKEGP